MRRQLPGDFLKTLIICKSIHHENTLRVAQVIADELDAELKTPETVDVESLAYYDLIGFGSGIYMGKHHKSLVNFVKDLDTLSGKNVFVFYTSGFSKFPARPAFESVLIEQLTEKGAQILDIFSCRGLETVGPFRIGGGKNKGHPDETDLNNARDFGKSLITS
ncbi:MAG: flavodoxin family protein [Candidatus Thorarchaeota archaeon]